MIKLDLKFLISVWDRNSLLRDTFIGEVVKNIEVTESTLEVTQTLNNTRTKGENERLLEATITFTITSSLNLKFK